jgi:hypothetical protein
VAWTESLVSTVFPVTPKKLEEEALNYHINLSVRYRGLVTVLRGHLSFAVPPYVLLTSPCLVSLHLAASLFNMTYAYQVDINSPLFWRSSVRVEKFKGGRGCLDSSITRCLLQTPHRQ